MASRFEVPDDLKHLVEKRGSSDRRKSDAADVKASGSAERRRKSRRAADAAKKKATGRKRKAD